MVVLYEVTVVCEIGKVVRSVVAAKTPQKLSFG